jgi:hypothetical protein
VCIKGSSDELSAAGAILRIEGIMLRLNAIINIIKGRPTIYKVSFSPQQENVIHDYNNVGLRIYDSSNLILEVSPETKVIIKNSEVKDKRVEWANTHQGKT